MLESVSVERINILKLFVVEVVLTYTKYGISGVVKKSGSNC